MKYKKKKKSWCTFDKKKKRKILNSHLFWLNSHLARLNQVMNTPDVQVQEPLVVVKKRGRV
jgi:hypothetical protein